MHPVVHVKRHETIISIEIDNPPVNASSQQVRQQLLEAIIQASLDPSIEALVLSGAGSGFMAGADISEFDLPAIPLPDPNDIHDALESLSCPVIAALHGSVLGGGLELAMACHYRIALSTARLGLPEVKLGLIPGAGGTQRLPRLADVAPALDMMLSGIPISAQRALQLGIIDAVVDDHLPQAAFALARQAAASPGALRVASRIKPDTPHAPEEFFDAYRKKSPAANQGGRAGHEIINRVQAGLKLPYTTALAGERAAFEACKNSPESRALRHVFFAERVAARIPGLHGGIATNSVKKVGVIGAGTMGGGIAMSFATAGIAVTLIEINGEALQRGLGLIRKNYDAAVGKGRITTAQAGQRMALIGGSLNYADIADCDLVIEAAFEDMKIKQAICRRLGGLCKPGAIIATNTSSLDVDALALSSGRPDDFIGMHFFSPANVMALLELVRGARTSPAVLATTIRIARTIGKVPVVSGVCYGFIGNRMLEGYLREAELMLMQGAGAAQIDKAIEASGMAMGPCRMMDMAGVDVVANVVLEREKSNGLPGGPEYRAVVRELYKHGRFGQKTARGFYRYEGRKPIEDPQLREICAQLAERHGIPRRTGITDEEIVERCMLPLINEGACILDEGIAYRAGDIDVVWTNGYGFPGYKGGPMHAADTIGAARLVSRLQHYAVVLGNTHGYWTPSNWLMRAVENNQLIADVQRIESSH